MPRARVNAVLNGMLELNKLLYANAGAQKLSRSTLRLVYVVRASCRLQMEICYMLKLKSGVRVIHGGESREPRLSQAMPMR